MCKTIKQVVRFQATPEEVYDLLADSQKHSRFTGKTAQISRKIGGEFRSYGGSAEGINVDLLRGKRIVQAWRDTEFPKGIFSMASVFLEPTKSGGTELTLIHRGVPKKLIPRIEKGWKTFYWKKMKSYLARTSDPKGNFR